jgi:hypothetical protein
MIKKQHFGKITCPTNNKSKPLPNRVLQKGVWQISTVLNLRGFLK